MYPLDEIWPLHLCHDVLKATIFVIHTGEDGPNSHVADAYIVAIQTELHATFFHLALYLALAS